MKLRIITLLIIAFMASNCSTPPSVENEIEIAASSAKVWHVITSPDYAKILGDEFDKDAFVESDWKQGSDVHFKYEPNKTISTGTISKLIEEELIQIDYDFSGFKYMEKYELIGDEKTTVLKLFAGPYTSDYNDQLVVWQNWLNKVKELSEQQATD